MKLDASCTLSYLIDEPTTVVAMLRPKSGESQFIQEEKFTIAPQSQVVEYTDSFGNLCQRTVLQPGVVVLSVGVIAAVNDKIDTDLEAAYTPIEELPHDTLQFLIGSRYCQSEFIVINDLANEIAPISGSGYGRVLAIRDWIYQNVGYQYGVTNSTTTALDTIHQRQGVCRDFTHLAIALCRSLSIPARMVVGYALDLKYMDLHAWFEAFVGGRWYTFDAVQPQTTGGRIVIGYGRDAADVAFITQFGKATLQVMEVQVREIAEEASNGSKI